MNRLNKSQQNVVVSLRSIIGNGVPDRVLIEMLTKARWNQEQVMEDFFAQGLDQKYGGVPSMYTASGGGPASENNIKTLFSKFSNQANRPTMDQDGLISFFTALKVDMEDPVTLIVTYAMGVKDVNRIEYSMFKKGCETFNADSVDKWIRIIPDLKKDLIKNTKLHREVYEFSYVFSCEAGLKTLDKEVAVALWPMFLKDRCEFLQIWINFIESNPIKIVKKDEWNMFYEMVAETKGSFKNYKDEGCWPLLFDEFVEYYAKNGK